MEKVSIWRLAYDTESYGDKAGWFILTTPDGKEDIEGGPWQSRDGARAFAESSGWQVMPLDDYLDYIQTTDAK